MNTTFEPSHRIRPLQDLRVIHAMHPGMISCPPETPLRTVARMMATYRVHAIIVHAHDDEELPGGDHWGVVTDADLVRVARDVDLDELTAQRIGVTPALLPAVDVYETEDEFVLELEVPGYEEKELTIEAFDHTVAIAGERK